MTEREAGQAGVFAVTFWPALRLAMAFEPTAAGGAARASRPRGEPR